MRIKFALLVILLCGVCSSAFATPYCPSASPSPSPSSEPQCACTPPPRRCSSPCVMQNDVVSAAGLETMAAGASGSGDGKACMKKCDSTYSKEDLGKCYEFCSQAVCRNGCDKLQGKCDALSPGKAREICNKALGAACPGS